jgi:hypothetical protein
MESLSEDYDLYKCEQKAQISHNDHVWHLYWDPVNSFAVLNTGKQVAKYTQPDITFYDALELVGVDNPTINLLLTDTYNSHKDILHSFVRDLSFCHVDVLSNYTVDYLVQVLQKYAKMNTLTDIEYNQMYRQVKNAANQVLIGDKGECVWEHHQVLEDAGFSVFPLERDSFGWLVGGIETHHGIIDFG